MKKIFKGIEVAPQSEIWHEKSCNARWLSGDIISIGSTPEHAIKTYVHADYASCEYKLKLNLFSFGKLKLNIPFTVIAPPVSVDEVGFMGDLNRLIDDYKCRKGLFLILNLKTKKTEIKKKVAYGKTLSSCIFINSFDSFTHYLNTLRSGYRRRIKTALKKGRNLVIKRIANSQFDEELYKLYLQMHAKSDFPLEKLPITFFKSCGCIIDVFYNDDIPLAFVMYQNNCNTMNFIFGGMDYKNRDKFDLYYNMLLYLMKIGIDTKVKQINFGQTAESSKCRIGCVLEDRYMLAFSGNWFLNQLLCVLAPLLQNNKKRTKYNVFH